MSLGMITSAIGEPIATDVCTATFEKPAYARVLVEVDMKKPVKRMIKFRMPSGEIREQKVTYEQEPLVCAECHQIGHREEGCRWKKGPNTAGQMRPGQARNRSRSRPGVRNQERNRASSRPGVRIQEPRETQQEQGGQPRVEVDAIAKQVTEEQGKRQEEGCEEGSKGSEEGARRLDWDSPGTVLALEANRAKEQSARVGEGPHMEGNKGKEQSEEGENGGTQHSSEAGLPSRGDPGSSLERQKGKELELDGRNVATPVSCMAGLTSGEEDNLHKTGKHNKKKSRKATAQHNHGKGARPG